MLESLLALIKRGQDFGYHLIKKENTCKIGKTIDCYPGKFLNALFRDFGDSLENFLQIDATLFGIRTMVADPHLARLDFIFGNSQKAFWHL